MITSTANTRIKDVEKLTKKASYRRERGLFVVEGIRMFTEIPRDELAEVYVSEGFLSSCDAGARGLLEEIRRDRSIGYETVTDTVYAAMSDTKSPQGIMAVVRMRSYSPEQLIAGCAESPLFLVLETIQDPGNLGTMFRSGEAAGVTAVIMDRGCADIYSPKVVRSTMGAVFRVPFIYTDDIRKTVKELRDAGVRTYAAHLKGKKSYDRTDLTGPAAFLIGNEAAGLTDETAALADEYVLIPMLGRVESLNAAVAASVLMFEAARQRRDING